MYTYLHAHVNFRVEQNGNGESAKKMRYAFGVPLEVGFVSTQWRQTESIRECVSLLDAFAQPLPSYGKPRAPRRRHAATVAD